ncbi:MAG: class I SAM-dependent methyltransferase [Alphaproteobacteria bacterium]|nr:MAG: class I SAM-dependent methyltransferase [Alphaproteobacteria bacterium]
MAPARHEGQLGRVYGAGSAEEIARLYDEWSERYDADMSSAGYRHPTICLALLARYLPRGAGPVLDAGAGTGLIGEWLTILGYDRIEALDISEGMLAVAARKNVYRKLHCLALGTRLPFADGAFAGIVCAGVFTTGHVGPEGLDELVRICRPGGVLVMTVKGALWEGGFGTRVAGLEATGRVTRLEETPPYLSMPADPATTPSLGVALRVNGSGG